MPRSRAETSRRGHPLLDREVIERERERLLVGDVSKCLDCHVLLFHDYAFISDKIDPDVLAESTTPSSHIALGRELLPDDSEPVGPGVQYCDSCSIDRETM